MFTVPMVLRGSAPWTSRLPVTTGPQPPPPAASRKPPARPSGSMIRAACGAADSERRARPGTGRSSSDRRARTAWRWRRRSGSAHRRRCAAPIMPGTVSAGKQLPVDVAVRDVADARDAGGEGFDRVDPGRGRRRRDAEADQQACCEITPNAMPSAPSTSCAAKPTPTNGRSRPD